MLKTTITPSKKPDFLTGGGEMEKCIRAFDWSKTPLGPLEGWPASLKNAVQICLTSRFPTVVCGGTDHITLYNDAYIPIAKDKHPGKMLGLPAKLAYGEIWPIVGRKQQQVMDTGIAYKDENLMLLMNKNGFLEENYQTFSLSPIGLADGNIEGVFITIADTTSSIIQERHLRTLNDLGLHSGEAKTTAEAFHLMARELNKNDADVPFALMYSLDAESHLAALECTVRLEPDTKVSPKTLSVDNAKSVWPLARTIQSRTLETVDVSGWPSLPSGRWEISPQQAVLVPLMTAGATSPTGILIMGANPRQKLDATYRNFYTFVASLISTAVANAQAYEKERQRAEALAEIDRAKTIFFSSVSHEFRTPLTLLLGPLEEALNSSEQPPLPATQRARLQMVQRNALRLLKLTNTVLDFSRLQAGRLQGHYQATDLAKLTINLSSAFRAAMEKAGLQFTVDATSLEEPVYIDHAMWEQVLFNLLSNAFKYTLQGSVTVSLKKVGLQAELCVSDTGAGIPSTELPRVFERFHRVQGVTGRSHEGTGIGLALAQELVKLHGGTIEVTSQVGKGSTFTVRIPLGKAHLPAEQIYSPRPSALLGPTSLAFVEEALQWLPEERESSGAPAMPMPVSTHSPLLTATVPAAAHVKILVADDNADMREYVYSLLSPYYKVIMATDGEAALRLALEQKPDLILSDVMMPRLDGLQLTSTLRQNPLTKWIPIILLSAKATEEARIEGLTQGADDYVAKPFSAKELLARIKTHVALGKTRGELQQTIEELQEVNAALGKSEHSYRTLTTISPVGIYHADKEGQLSYINQRGCKIMGHSVGAMLGDKWIDNLHPADKERILQLWDKTRQGKIDHFKADYRYVHPDGAIVWVTSEAVPQQDSNGQCVSYIGTLTDITELKALEAVRLKEATSYREQLEQFTDTLCHELRNPLNGIYGNLSLLQGVLAKLRNNLAESTLSPVLKAQWLAVVSEAQEYTSDIAICAKHQKVMLDDVLSLSKLEAGKVELNPKDFDPKQAIREVGTMLKSALFQKHLKLHIKLDERDQVVKGDADRIKQILLNLLSNAIKFTPAGGDITLGLRFLEQTADHIPLQFTVEDSGIGMTIDEKARLFNRFAQASRETFQEYGGSGLGLVISKHLIELMQGKIEVESEKGRGTKFTVTLCCQHTPLEKTLTSKPKPPSTQSVGIGRKGLRVLIAEDNLINQRVLKKLLEQEGCHCDVVGDGQQAVAFLEKTCVDVVLMDIQMPGMNGLEATQAIRQREKSAAWQQRPPVPIIGLSGNILKEFGGDIPPGMTDYLSKPYEKNKLLEKIRQNTQPCPLPTAGPSPGVGAQSAESSEALITEENLSKQSGWDCFDIAIGLPRDKLCQFALEHKDDLYYRQLLAPEIRTAAAVTTVLMNQQEEQALEAKEHTTALAELFHLLEIAQQWGEKEDQENVVGLIESALQVLPEAAAPSSFGLRQLALPLSMHTQELRRLVNAYTEVHEAVKSDVATCNKLLRRPPEQPLSLGELNAFFSVAEQCKQHETAYLVFEALYKKFAPHEAALQAYCESEAVYERYVRDYYGQRQWFAFQPAYAGGKNTSMVDIAAKCLDKQVIIHHLKNGQREEIYHTQGSEGLSTLHVHYNGRGHFVALKSNEYYLATLESILLTHFGVFSTEDQTCPSLTQRGKATSQHVSKIITGYLQ